MIQKSSYLHQVLSISLNNKYTNVYIKLIIQAKNRADSKQDYKEKFTSVINSTGYCEAHHILPKSFKLGGNTDMDNIAYLSAKEHFISHRLLAKMFNKDSAFARYMIMAIFQMSSKQKNKLFINSRIYEHLKLELSSVGFSDEHRSNMSASAKKSMQHKIECKFCHKLVSRQNYVRSHGNKCIKNFTESKTNPLTKKCIHCNKEINTVGYTLWHGNNCLLNPSGPVARRKSTNKMKQAVSDRNKNQKKIECEYCKKYFDRMNFLKWHGNNCLLNPSGTKNRHKYTDKERQQKAEYAKNLPKKQCMHCKKIVASVDYYVNHGDFCKQNLTTTVKQKTPHIISDTGKKNIKNGIKNMSTEQKKIWKEKLLVAAKNREKINCMHCNKFYSPGNFKRWHGDNCKDKLK